MGFLSELFNPKPNVRSDSTEINTLTKALSYDSSVKVRTDAAEALDRLGWIPKET
jgi:hypothetical protein